MFKNYILLLVVVALTSCSTSTNNHERAPYFSKVYAYQISTIDMSRAPTVSLRVAKDPKNFSLNISGRMEGVGFRLSGNSGVPDYYADVDYKTYWDVVHQTFVYFQIILVDAKTGESRIRLRYVGGRHSSHGCDTALDMVFKELSQDLKNGT
jgi:hypothetical protein